jgi:hypothetical protein
LFLDGLLRLDGLLLGASSCTNAQQGNQGDANGLIHDDVPYELSSDKTIDNGNGTATPVNRLLF